MGLDLGLEPGLGIEHLHDPNMLNTAVWNLDKIDNGDDMIIEMDG